MSVFVTDAPRLKNQFTDDSTLFNFLKNKIPNSFQSEVFQDLEHFGERVITDILEISHVAERDCPELYKVGEKLQIRISPAWKKLHSISAKEGLISLGQEKRFGEFARIYQFAKKYLF